MGGGKTTATTTTTTYIHTYIHAPSWGGMPYPGMSLNHQGYTVLCIKWPIHFVLAGILMSFKFDAKIQFVKWHAQVDMRHWLQPLMGICPML